MTDDTRDDRKAILSRRARFLAVALAGATSASCTAAACLRIAPDAGTEADGPDLEDALDFHQDAPEDAR